MKNSANYDDKRHVGLKAYISLILAISFFSGLFYKT